MLSIIHQEPDYAIGTLDRVILTVWRGDTDEAAFARINPVYDRMAEQNDAFAFLTVMTGTARIPTDAGRKALAHLLKRHEARIKGAAVTVEASGFKGAALRSAVTGMTMLAQMPYPHRTFASVDEAVPWFAAEVGLGVTGQALKDALDRLREAA